MGKAIFKSNRHLFERNNEAFKDMVLGHMAQDIEIGIKTTAGTPVSNTKASGNKRGGGGHMKTEARHSRMGMGMFRVDVNKEYAAYQERGMRADGSHRVRNYSTSGTSAGWFKRAVNTVLRSKGNYINEARRALNL